MKTEFILTEQYCVVTNHQLEFLDYRYHFQDDKNCLIFRYDSTPHFPNLAIFPHHKHLPNDVISSIKPKITEVLKEASYHYSQSQ